MMTRPKTYDPKKGKGGGRQKIWARLRKGKCGVAELVEASGSAESSVRSYVHQLVKHGYVQASGDGAYLLVNDTGHRAPSVNMAEGTLYDWNLHKPMTGAALRRIWEKSGLSVAAWCVKLGMVPTSNSKVLEMFDGKRPVSPAVEAKAKEFDSQQPPG